MTAVLDQRLSDVHELSLIEVDMLAVLGESPTGRIQMGDLPKSLPSLPRRFTRHVRRLEERGLLQRSVDPWDRRRVVLTMTTKGRKVVEQAMHTYAESVRTHFIGPLSRPQVSEIAQTCEQINAPLKRS
ncbi:MarR family winged helix-turn-helix transcriptional regulator [Mycolicibacter virginiensis]|uniref:MarR family transcriptional regulator n=1 Tax=Mycolicibacter virginiensis TaxID=1795032 RepID=A0A9X7IK05_9MYCO|nr:MULTISPECIES: MarR family transcriptional regulator [Mycobacteriaceae]PQM50712.1 MarR family transcriptional regulator [Mycolicibacter virginiensis]ULP48833.1 MarR family transcriptional regulator [Mycolicibacter virginiensis]